MVLDRIATVAVVDLRASDVLGLYLDFGPGVVGDVFVGGPGVGSLSRGRKAEQEEGRLE